MAKLDVLIPHFQDPQNLALSLASVTAQTWTGDIRIVVVDDGSSRADFRAVEALVAEQSLPVTLQRNSENRGRPYTRNRLLDAIDGDYVAWLDAGDVWYPEKLTRQFDHFSRMRFDGEDTDRVWVTCHYDWQWSNGRPRRVRQQVDGSQIRELLLGDRLRAYLWTLLGTAGTFRAIGSFDERLPRLQDLDYFIRFVRAGGRLVTPAGDESLCLYHKSDLGRDAREIRRCNDLIFEKYLTSYQSQGPAFMRRTLYNAETLSARYARNNNDTAARLYYTFRAFRADPRRGVGLLRNWNARSA
jgi:glycosyltransferase involved in cell wall biosynthesis